MKKNKKRSQELLDQAISLNDNKRYNESILKLNELIELCPNKNQSNMNFFHCLLAMNYSDIGEFEKALYYYNSILDLELNDEYASLGKYIVLVKLKRGEEAIQEMINFLKRNKADLYQVTIEELLEGLENGFMTDYEFEINQMAYEHNVSIIPNASR